MAKGYFCLVLHAHLPFVRHPEHERFLEEEWLYEAITETYIPLIEVMEGWRRDGVPFRMAMSITPPLAAMLDDELLRARYRRHLARLVELAEKEVARTQKIPEFHLAARMYLRKFQAARALYDDRWRGDLLAAFISFRDSGNLEICASAATHGFLPLLSAQPEAVRAQVRIGAASHARRFGRAARGFWIPECGYYPGLDGVLRDAGVGHFFLDAHGLLYADSRPRYGVFAPALCPSGVAAFARDPESSKSVWSAEEGYPGDFRYREFHRDIGYDLPLDYIGEYIHPGGARVATGIKYHRVTGKGVPLHEKQPYREAAALATAIEHADNFLSNRESQALYLASLMDRPPAILSPYDAELFGHWWFEGPVFLDMLMRKICRGQGIIEAITPSEYLERHAANQIATPSFSSWGNKGYAETWLEESNDWIYRHLHMGAERMIEMARRYRGTGDALARRSLNQMARELLLAQSSDWAFIMKTKTMVEYAVRRTKDHLLAVGDIYELAKEGKFDERLVAGLEARNNIFPEIRFEEYAEED